MENATKPPLVAYSLYSYSSPLMLKPQDALKYWLSAGDRAYAACLDQCEVFTIEDTLIIRCPDLALLQEVEMHTEQNGLFAQRMDKQTLSVVCPGYKDLNIPVDMITEHIKNTAIAIPPFKLSFPGNGDLPTAIVRMADHKGLWCSTDIERHSGAKANDWVGKDMSKFHIPEELQRLTDTLLAHSAIKEFSYRAIAFTGQDIEMTVSAFLGKYQGDLCRFVQVLNSANL